MHRTLDAPYKSISPLLINVFWGGSGDQTAVHGRLIHICVLRGRLFPSKARPATSKFVDWGHKFNYIPLVSCEKRPKRIGRRLL
jgi:hypothetical protein